MLTRRRFLEKLIHGAAVVAAAPIVGRFVPSRVKRAIDAMDITTLRWETCGGMRLNFKVMSILVP